MFFRGFVEKGDPCGSLDLTILFLIWISISSWYEPQDSASFFPFLFLYVIFIYGLFPLSTLNTVFSRLDFLFLPSIFFCEYKPVVNVIFCLFPFFVVWIFSLFVGRYISFPPPSPHPYIVVYSGKIVFFHIFLRRLVFSNFYFSFDRFILLGCRKDWYGLLVCMPALVSVFMTFKLNSYRVV